MDELLSQWFFQAPLIVSFCAGILSFLSPCVLPLIPAYMSYISGVSLQEIKEGKINRWYIFVRACMFILGFGIVFMCVGMAIQSVIHILHSQIFNIIAGLIVIVFGIHFLGIFEIKWLYKTKRLDFELKHPSLRFLAPFILGVSFAFGWTPCTGPIFGSITFMAGASPLYGGFLLALYIVGLGIPFLLLALLLERGLELLNKCKKYMRIIEIIAGVLLIIIGILIMSGNFNMISELAL